MTLTQLTLRRLGAAIAIAGTAAAIPAIALASASAPAGPGLAAAAGTAAARCPAGALTEWIGVPGSGTAGSTYFMLEISNTSARACTLYGFPGVSAVTARGHQIGSMAERSGDYPEQLLTLQPQDTVHVILRIIDVSSFTASACRPAVALGLRVYAPGAYRSSVVPFLFRACARRGPIDLTVSAAIAGVGIP
jgi:Protein of unknown function (DUF4232)